MVPTPGTETSGAVGAADVNVEAWLEAQGAKLAHVDAGNLRR